MEKYGDWRNRIKEINLQCLTFIKEIGDSKIAVMP